VDCVGCYRLVTKHRKSRNLYLIGGNGANDEYQIEKTVVRGSCDDEECWGAQGRTERIHRWE